MQTQYIQRIKNKNAAMGYEKTKPIQTQFLQRPKLTQTHIHKRNTKINGNGESEKTNPSKANFKRDLVKMGNHE